MKRMRSLSAAVAGAVLSSVCWAGEAGRDGGGGDGPVTVLIGVRDDARPFSYRKPTGASETVLAGFGGYTIELCRHVLKEMKALPEYRHLAFRAYTTNARERFKGLSEHGRLFMLCGPDSITLKRLADYRSSHPVFESGMTYAYVDPRSPRFPRGQHCDHVIGVVRGTTADSEGLQDIANRNLLARFDEALDLELGKTSEKLGLANERLREIVREELELAERESDEAKRVKERRRGDFESLEDLPDDTDLDTLAVAVDNLPDPRLAARINGRLELGKTSENPGLANEKLRRIVREELELAKRESDEAKSVEEKRRRDAGLLDGALSDTDPNRLAVAVDNLPYRHLAGRINGRMGAAYASINGDIARSIVTDECPGGHSSMPVRKYPDHNDGIGGFCNGDVLYYLGDYDIIRNKVREFGDCDVVLNRFTRSKEVYGVFFSKAAYYVPPGDVDPDDDPDGGATGGAGTGNVFETATARDLPANAIDVARFYATFNNTLLMSMQGSKSVIEQIFSREFDGQEKSEELAAFFESFKISSFDE